MLNSVSDIILPTFFKSFENQIIYVQNLIHSHHIDNVTASLREEVRNVVTSFRFFCERFLQWIRTSRFANTMY